jgi:hypothetical protein
MPPLTPSKIPEPEDIFSGTGSGRGGAMYPASPETTASIAESPGRGFGRKLVRLLFLALGAAVIVGAGYFGYHYFLATTAKPTPAQNENANENANTNQPANANENIPVNAPEINTNVNTPEVNTNTPQPLNSNIPAPTPGAIAPQDDPNSTVDTDHDGLTDFQEVHIYHTDLMNPDTDGDGFSDGDEVKNGYNPLGPGKLPPLPVTK